MTPGQKFVIHPAATLGYLIFTAAVVSNPFLWSLGALITLNAMRENGK